MYVIVSEFLSLSLFSKRDGVSNWYLRCGRRAEHGEVSKYSSPQVKAYRFIITVQLVNFVNDPLFDKADDNDT